MIYEEESDFLHDFIHENIAPVLPLITALRRSHRGYFIVLCHVMKFLSSYSKDAAAASAHLADTLMILGESVQKYLNDEITPTGASEDIYTNFFNSLRPLVLKCFTLPTRCQQSYFKVNEVLACFLDFLIQILHSELCYVHSHSCKDQTWGAVLARELTYLVTFLGDEPFHCTELEPVPNILSETEILANDVGSFVYTVTVLPKHIMVSCFTASVDALLKKISDLMSRIKEHCLKSLKTSSISASRASVVGSSFILDSVVEDLKNLMNRRYPMSTNDAVVWDKIKRFHKELISLRSCIKDVKARWGINKNELEASLAETRDLAYEAEYVISSYALGNVPHWYLLVRIFAIMKKMKRTRGRLEEMKSVSCQLRVLEITDDFGGEVSSRNEGLPSSSDDNFVMGFEENRTRILDNLTGGSKNLEMISIVGMPGLGKTTLAQHLYIDQAILYHFDYRAWSVVSETYRKRRVLTDILITLSTEPVKDKILEMETESLALKIYQSLKGRRYLIVIDDIWDSSKWDDLKRYFPDDGTGSRILFTTRIKDTAPTGTTVHEFDLLMEAQCRDLLVKKVFKSKPCPPELENIAKEIARKCHGLPLAVVTTAGILAEQENEEQAWERMDRKLDSGGGLGDYMKVLELSYQHLPHHWKSCFLYLGVFPKGEEIESRKLTWLWIAQGFVGKEGQKSLEQVAEEYIAELINRSLLTVSKFRSDEGIRSCRIHDLLHDMCLQRGHRDMFLKSTNKNFSIYEKHLHLHVRPKITALWRLHCCSLTSYNPSDQAPGFKMMPLLRVVDFLIEPSKGNHRFNNHESPVNLRYLSVDKMPFELRSFMNLEFLYLRHTGLLE